MAVVWQRFSIEIKPPPAFRIGLANINAHIPEIARLIERGTIDPRPLVSHVMPFSDAAKGYDIFSARKDNVMKVLLKP